MTKQREGLVVNVSHNDLDGIVSAVVHTVAAEHITSVSEEYGKVRSAVRFSAGAGMVAPLLRDLAELGVQVVVTDIFLSKDEFAIIDAVEPSIPEIPLLVDHHRGSEIHGHRTRTMVSASSCGAMNTLKYYENLPGSCRVAFPDWVRRLAVLANDYDMWIHSFPESRKLNALASLLGAEGMFGLIMKERENFFFDCTHSSRWLKRQQDRIDSAVADTQIFQGGEQRPRFALLPPRKDFSGSDVNEISDRLVQERDVECLAYIYEDGNNNGGSSRARVSLRGKNRHPARILEILKREFGAEGGGHYNACGVRFPVGFSVSDVFRCLAAVLEREAVYGAEVSGNEPEAAL